MSRLIDSPNIHSLTLLKSVALSPLRPDIFPSLLLSAIAIILSIQVSFKWLYLLIPAVLFVIFSALLCIWSVSVKCTLRYSKASLDSANSICVTPPPHCGSAEVCTLQRLETGRIFFKFQKLEYIYDDDSKLFKELEYPLSLCLKEYVSSPGIDSSQLLELSYDRFGYNLLDIPLPTFSALFKEHATAPFFVFQVLCVVLWMLDEYWQYSLFTLLMFVLFEALLVQRRIKSLQDVRNMRSKPFTIYVYRLSQWQKIPTTHLLPGDIVSLVRSPEGCVVPADMILLYGSCVVNESLLTGESVPQIKEPAANSNLNLQLDISSTHKTSVIFGGTRVELHSYAKATFSKIKSPPDGGCLAYVLRTGFATNQGNLIRTILFASERVTVNNAESFFFILVLLVFAILASGYVLYHGLQDPDRSRFKLLLNCIMIITSVVPPELPMELSLAVNNSLAELMKKKIFCTEPFRIPFAGSVFYCCFDKTGTLTCDDFVLKGLAVCPDDESKEQPSELHPIDKLKSNVRFVIGGCHSLVRIDKQIVGDPLEKIAFQNSEWNLIGDGTCSNSRGEVIEILYRFPFSSVLKRMSCVINSRGGTSSSSKYIVVSKGAPEVVESMLHTIPADYRKIYMHYSMQGCRVLAFSYKFLEKQVSVEEIRSIERQELESGHTFCGFLVLESPLKPESLKTIQELNDSAHRVVMITGDHILTACEVARLLTITQLPILVLSDSRNGLEWRSLDGTVSFPFDVDKVTDICDKYDLCVSGDALEKITPDLNSKIFQSFICEVRVFARVSPKHKELILTSIKSRGFSTLMCGDGTNDVGALKQAHVGVALIEGNITQNRGRRPHKSNQASTGAQISALENSAVQGNSVEERLDVRRQQMETLLDSLENSDVPTVQLGDASIAAPFTSKVANISCCADILRQGRCTLVATMQMYKILALNCLITAYSMSVLYLDGVKLGDTQATCFGMAMALMYLGLSHSKPINKLSRQRPHDSVFSWYMFCSIGGQFLVHLASLMIAVQWAHPFTSATEGRDPDGDFKINVLNTVVFLIQSSMTISTFAANYQGRPFMQNINENVLMFRLVAVTLIVIFLCALDLLTPLTEFMELAPLPDDQLRSDLVLLMAFDFMVVFLYQKFLDKFFARHPEEHRKVSRSKKET